MALFPSCKACDAFNDTSHLAMLAQYHLACSFIFLSFAIQTTQVHIDIGWRSIGRVEGLPALIVADESHAFCFDIAPGICCVPPISRYAGWTGANFVSIRALQPVDIAIVWSASRPGSNSQCSGPILETRIGN